VNGHAKRLHETISGSQVDASDAGRSAEAGVPWPTAQAPGLGAWESLGAAPAGRAAWGSAHTARQMAEGCAIVRVFGPHPPP
jgi:hypothetical protein